MYLLYAAAAVIGLVLEKKRRSMLKSLITGVQKIELVPSKIETALYLPQFGYIGHFVCPQVRKLQLSTWWSEAHQVIVVAYKYPKRSIWWEVISCYNKGVTITLSSNLVTGLRQPPQHNKVYCPGLPFEQLLQECLCKRPSGYISIDPKSFVVLFCRSFNESTEWRLTNMTTEENVEGALTCKRQLLGQDK